MAGPVSYERQQRNNELKSADALERIAIALEKLHEHLTKPAAPAPSAPAAPVAQEKHE